MKFFKKSDILIILLFVIAAFVIWKIYRTGYADMPSKAEIYYKSELVKTIELDTKEEKLFKIPQNDHVVFHLFLDGSIAFEESDCPDKICIRTGRIETVGEAAACLPNGILMKIVSDDRKNSDDPDIIVGR